MSEIGVEAADGRTIGSVEKMIDILEAVKHQNGAGLTELTEMLEMSHSSIHHYLLTLQQRGYIVKRGTTYDIGARFLALGGYARMQQNLYHIAKEKIDELSAATGWTSRLVIKNGGTGITLYQAVPTTLSEFQTYEGFEEDLHATAAGKAMLAELPPGDVADFLESSDLTEHTDNTITSPDRLLAEFESIREQDYAFDDQEHFDGFVCVSSSILSSDGAVLGSISVSAPEEEVDSDRFCSEVSEQIQNATGVIKITHTYSDWNSE